MAPFTSRVALCPTLLVSFCGGGPIRVTVSSQGQVQARPSPARPRHSCPGSRAHFPFCPVHLPCLVLGGPSFAPSLSLLASEAGAAVPPTQSGPSPGKPEALQEIHRTLRSGLLCRPGDLGQMGGTRGTQKHSAGHASSYCCCYFYWEKETREKPRAEAQTVFPASDPCLLSLLAGSSALLPSRDRQGPCPLPSMFPTLESP